MPWSTAATLGPVALIAAMLESLTPRVVMVLAGGAGRVEDVELGAPLGDADQPRIVPADPHGHERIARTQRPKLRRVCPAQRNGLRLGHATVVALAQLASVKELGAIVRATSEG